MAKTLSGILDMLAKFMLVVEAILLISVAVSGWTASRMLMDAAEEAEHLPDRSSDFPVPAQGYMIPSPGDVVERDGVAGCQALYRVGEVLEWASVGVNVSLELPISTNVKVGEFAVGEKNSFTCPIDAGEEADCSMMNSQAWDVHYETGRTYYKAGMFFFATSILMPFWILMKVISMHGGLVDMVVRKLTCGKIDNEGLMDDLMLRLNIMKSCPMVKLVITAALKYLRFKLLSNVLLLPLTSLGYNKKCGGNLYVKIPMNFEFWYGFVAIALADLFYLMLLYTISTIWKSVKQYRVLYLPFAISTGAGVILVYGTAAEGSISTIFGFSLKSFAFEMSASISIFHVTFLFLSLTEVLNMPVQAYKVFKTLGKVEENKSLPQV